jgi:hypothetical protein
MLTIILLILALISFTAATFNAALRINLIALGLTLLTLNWLLTAAGI